MQNQTWNNQNARNMAASQPWQKEQSMGQAAQKPLTEEEMSFDLLFGQKDLMSCTVAGIEEISHKPLRQVVFDAFQEIEQDQLDLFAIMQQQGWYETKPANAQDIAAAKQKYQQIRATL